MAITIIKEGKTENYKFKTTCPICGCEFEYELCDLKKDYSGNVIYTVYPPQYGYRRYVECPCCHEKIIHDNCIGYYDDVPPINYTNVGDTIISEDSCENCSWFQHLKLNPEKQYEVGDTPCTWCPKMQPKCTCK